MSETAVFVRHTHPAAQGSHSYSIALVTFDNQAELKALEKMFSSFGTGLPEPWNHDYQWFGGNSYDLVATFPTPPETLTPYKKTVEEDMKKNKHSVGDHRWIGYYTAKELLAIENEEEAGETFWQCGCDCEECMDGRCGEGDCEHAHQ